MPLCTLSGANTAEPLHLATPEELKNGLLGAACRLHYSTMLLLLTLLGSPTVAGVLATASPEEVKDIHAWGGVVNGSEGHGGEGVGAPLVLPRRHPC